jgi:uncharacterized protein (DUF885 family)
VRLASPAAATLALLVGLSGCTTVVVSEPGLERDLAAALEARRLDAAAAGIVRFRDGLLAEAQDLGRIDRADRAAAARWRAADLRAGLADVHRDRLDREGRVDLDIARFLLDGAEARLRLADAEEKALPEAALPLEQFQWLAKPGPPTRDDLAVLAAPWKRRIDRVPGVMAEQIRAVARRERQVADLLRRRGNECAVLFGEEGTAARGNARALADALEEAAKMDEEDAKSRPGGEGGFAPAAGRERFETMLRVEHGVTESPEGLEVWGLDLLARTQKDLEDLAAAQFPGKTWKEAMAEVRRDHPTAEELPGEALRAAESARDFCIEQGFVTIPPAARLGHVGLVGDDMARAYPFAAYNFRLTTGEGESGTYVVSPGATWMSPEQHEERLLGNCRAWTRAVAAHEMWPGHHLQFWVADHACSALRREALTPVYVEGWGLYCEWLLERHGYFRTPAERLAVLAMRAWRACRVVLDVRLHCGGFTPEQGVDFLVENAATTRDAARAEVTRYMTSPTQPFSYAWGWHEILRLREEEERRLGPKFDERAYHDRLLRCGPVPFPFVRRLFGYDEEASSTSGPGPDRNAPAKRR